MGLVIILKCLVLMYHYRQFVSIDEDVSDIKMITLKLRTQHAPMH